MQNKKIEKLVVKAGYGALISLMLGIVYKQGEKINETLDRKYERDHGIKTKKLF